MATKRTKRPEPIGGGWYRLADGSKVRGRARAYEAAGLDPDKDGNRRSDAARQRRRKMKIAERRQRIAALFVQGVTYQDMADALDVSLATVAGDMAANRDEWRERRSSDMDDWVVDELEVLDADEARLRQWQRQVADVKLRLAVQDRVDRIRQNRRDLVGMNAPEVRRVVVASSDQPAGGETLFRAGGDTESYQAALRAAQGLDYDKRHLRAVK